MRGNENTPNLDTSLCKDYEIKLICNLFSIPFVYLGLEFIINVNSF